MYECEIGRACGMHHGDEECVKVSGGKTRRKETSNKTSTSMDINMKLR
jgi:hypothetical protein